jgi:N-formylglutamate amidohydrolase
MERIALSAFVESFWSSVEHNLQADLDRTESGFGIVFLYNSELFQIELQSWNAIKWQVAAGKRKERTTTTEVNIYRN